MKYRFLIILTLIGVSLFAQDSLEVLLTIDCPFDVGFQNKFLTFEGDLNSDGYDDFVVSKYQQVTGDGDSGKVFIYLGKEILTPEPDFILEGNGDDKFGASVSIAGDLNGDGYDDLVIGAPYNVPYEHIGAVYIYFGSSDFDVEPDVILYGEDYAAISTSSFEFGYVDSSCDFDNDGFDDLVVSAIGPDLSWNGQVDVFMGSPNFDTISDFHYYGENLDFTCFVRINDINGDNYDDLFVCHAIDQTIYDLILGSEEFNFDPDYSFCNEFWMYGLYYGGDLNNDEFSDILYRYNNGYTGYAFGNEEIEFVFNELCSHSTSSFPRPIDINNDGYDDIAIQLECVNTYQYEGLVKFYYGGENIDQIADITIEGEIPHAYLGRSLYPIGDVNGDGKNDILIATGKDCMSSLEYDSAWVYTFAGDLPIQYGDIDQNGEVQAYDASIALQYTVGLDPIPEIDPLPWEEETILRADVDGNEEIQAYDASLILQYVVEIITEFPVQGRRQETPKSEVSIKIIDNELIFSTKGNLYGFEVEIENMGITKFETEMLSSINENKIALASAEPVTGKFLRISMKNEECKIKNVTLKMIINTEKFEKVISLLINNNPKLPNKTVLHSAYPNPFNPTTTIKFSVQENETAMFEIFNLKGQTVKSYPIFNAGNYEVNWNGTDDNGNKVTSGVFFYKLKSESVLQVQKMLLLK